MRRLPPICCLLFVAFASLGAAGDYARVVLEPPAATPFSVVRYEVVSRGRTTSAVHRRQLPSFNEPLHGLALLTREEAQALFTLLEALDATALPDATDVDPAHPAREDRVVWRVEVSLGGKAHTFRVADPIEQPDRRYWKLVDAIQRQVTERAGELPFKNVFFPPGELGWVNILTIPAARVSVDGFDVRQETPLYSYELAAGVHSVRLRSLDGGYDRTYKVKVEPGVTTHLAIDLR